MTAFSAWLESQVSQGLTHLHLSVRQAPGCTADAVRQELLAAEDSLSRDPFREAPRASSWGPPEIASFIGRVSL